ncbi:uncharacterized protein LOC118648637 [Monomorium pharaonis]|uniref:uncharacterized protein LOC118648637 n=1 Tax=Monomorium pharaonis TaxID=307658 RepID=UPI0017463EC8|nr:uncharacterized protein LOC118648637 [Monomorium pharaonis]
MNECAIVLPKEEDKWLSFRNYDRKERLPYVVYADLECLLEKKDEGEGFMTTENGFGYQRHRAFSVGYYVRCALGDESSSIYISHRGQDCVSWFAKELNSLAHRAKDTLGAVAPMMELTREETRDFSDSTFCHICGKIFLTTDVRVRDHCHITGRYRGAAHSYCNLNYHNSFVIPVFFHNLSGYDAHFIIKEIANEYEGRVDLLPLNKETYISFTKNVSSTREKKWHNCVKLRFVDSYKFLNENLGKLVSYLDRDDLRITRSMFSDLDDEDFELLTRKGVFPYEYLDSVDRLNDTELPSREAFYSSLTGEEVSEDDHKHAVMVWERFNIRNLGEYSDLYLKTDVLLLADVFEKFRENSIESYGLDPAHYYTLPGYTWDAMLKYTGVRFELLTDIDMVLFVERGVRGGLSQCSNRYARANNRYLPCYDSSQPSSFLMYYDVNNLYGWAMCQPLPYSCFQWLDDIANFDVMSVSADSYFGYILEVDLAYPHELHDAHADLPFCPLRATPPDRRNVKLLATLHDKSHYVIHYRNLQQCLRHGLRLTRIHRVLRFAQFPWLRGYIELNTRFRIGATNEFERNMYKLMNNAVFGKTMENVRDRVDVRLVTSWDGRHGAEALIAKPNFHSRSIFAEDLMAIELRRLEVTMNKPLYVGMAILEIAKTRLYEFHYDYMLPLYRDKCKIMYTDTDSLIYFIECYDAYEDMKRFIDRFDTSNFPENNPYAMPLVNKSVPGLMKDENCGAIMTEFVGLRAKMYATRVLGGRNTKKIKGVKKNVVERTITFDDFTRCL